VGKKDQHRQDLTQLFDAFVYSGDAIALRRYILSNSNLPSPRANLELAAAFSELAREVSEEGSGAVWELALSMAAVTADEAPVGTPEEFVPFCGALAVGAIASTSAGLYHEALTRLKALARDPRWRMREAVSMGLQQLLEFSPQQTIEQLASWVEGGDFLEMRAAAAAVADPAALKHAETALSALEVHRAIVQRLLKTTERKSDAFRILRKALGYTLSVVVQAVADPGFEFMKGLIETRDPDLAWIVKQNLQKNRLVKNFPIQVEAAKHLLERGRKSPSR
jgi:hypothetical protein